MVTGVGVFVAIPNSRVVTSPWRWYPPGMGSAVRPRSFWVTPDPVPIRVKPPGPPTPIPTLQMPAHWSTLKVLSTWRLSVAVTEPGAPLTVNSVVESPCRVGSKRPGPDSDPSSVARTRPGPAVIEYVAEPLASDSVPDALFRSGELNGPKPPLLGCQSRSPPPRIV